MALQCNADALGGEIVGRGHLLKRAASTIGNVVAAEIAQARSGFMPVKNVASTPVAS